MISIVRMIDRRDIISLNIYKQDRVTSFNNFKTWLSVFKSFEKKEKKGVKLNALGGKAHLVLHFKMQHLFGSDMRGLMVQTLSNITLQLQLS